MTTMFAMTPMTTIATLFIHTLIRCRLGKHLLITKTIIEWILMDPCTTISRRRRGTFKTPQGSRGRRKGRERRWQNISMIKLGWANNITITDLISFANAVCYTKSRKNWLFWSHAHFYPDHFWGSYIQAYCGFSWLTLCLQYIQSVCEGLTCLGKDLFVFLVI